jgi:hypothetical protein
MVVVNFNVFKAQISCSPCLLIAAMNRLILCGVESAPVNECLYVNAANVSSDYAINMVCVVTTG